MILTLQLEIYIVAPREYHTQLSQFLSEYGNADNASVEFVWVDDMVGSADGLRAVNERIRLPLDAIIYYKLNITLCVQSTLEGPL